MEVYFFRNGKRYYYIFENKEYEISEVSLNKLKEKIKLPFVAKFNLLSVSQVQKICGRLKFDNVQYSFQSNDGNFEVHFFEKKHFVDAYCIVSKSCMCGRNPNCKAYILTKFDNKNILMEVTQDYINNNDCMYYFLHSELTQDERAFFSNVYERLEIDYVYNITHEKQGLLRRRRK